MVLAGHKSCCIVAVETPMRLYSTLAVAVSIASATFAQDVVTQNQLARSAEVEPITTVPNGYIVSFAPGVSKNARAMAALQANVQLRHNYDSLEAISITAPNANALNALRNNPSVIRVSPDAIQRGRVKPGGDATGALFPLVSTQQVITYEVQRIGMPG